MRRFIALRRSSVPSSSLRRYHSAFATIEAGLTCFRTLNTRDDSPTLRQRRHRRVKNEKVEEK